MIYSMFLLHKCSLSVLRSVTGMGYEIGSGDIVQSERTDR